MIRAGAYRLSMGLRVRLLMIVGVVLVSLALVVAAAFWAVSARGGDVSQAVEAYRTLAWSRLVGDKIEEARAAAAAGDRRDARSKMQSAIYETEQGDPNADPFVIDAILQPLRSVEAALRTPATTPEDVMAQSLRLGEIREQTGLIAESTRERIIEIEREWLSERKRAEDGLLTIGSVSALIVLLAVWSQYRGILDQMSRFNTRLQRIVSGQLHERLRGSPDGELGMLANSINLLAERQGRLLGELEARVRNQSADLARSERLASVGFLAAGVAHEINNPLAVIAGEAELLLPQAEGPYVEGLEIIRDEAFKCKRITQRLLQLSRPGGAETQRLDLKPIAELVTRNARTLADERSVVLTCKVPDPIIIEADPTEIQQVLLNLIVNAIEADAERVHVAPANAPERIGIKVSDNGRGLEPEQLMRVFEPFYTTKTGEFGGTGLGLALAYAIIQQSGGLLEAMSDGPFRGSVFRMTWPMSG